MQQYLKDLQFILDNGVESKDRTGTGTISVFGMQSRYDLTKGFPAVTTKKLAWRAVVSELLWFIEGSGDERRLAEILYGDRNARTDHGVLKPTIWTDNARANYWTPKATFEGDLGRVYGVQWRKWKSIKKTHTQTVKDDFGTTYNVQGGLHCKEVDQLAQLIDGIKRDPEGRRHILTAWNPGELDQMALPPCHAFAQFYVRNGKLSCQMYQRSADFFLGVPFNIASYSLFTHMIAQVCGLGVGELVHTIGDAHIYLNHIDQVKEQLSRETLASPTLKLNSSIDNIDKFSMSDIELENYTSHSAIKAVMAV
jgi:thymidylate synthase